MSKDAINTNLPFGVRLTGGLKLRKAGITGAGVRVAIIDSGIDAKHPGFNGRIVKQQWYREGPLHDHGTHIAGTVHMMAPDADIYDYRVYGKEGNIDVDDAIIQAIKQACDDECRVINLCLCLEAHYINPMIQDQIKIAHEKGVIVVCSSSKRESTNPLINSTWYVHGITSIPSSILDHVISSNDFCYFKNENSPTLIGGFRYPAFIDEVLQVAAVGNKGKDLMALFSDSNPDFDYYGVGSDVWSFKAGGGFQVMSGTSMACAHVTGFVAAISCEGNKIANSKLNASLRKQFLVNLNMSTNCKKAPKISFLTFLDQDECDAVWREEMDSDYDRLLSMTLNEMSLLKDRLSNSRRIDNLSQ